LKAVAVLRDRIARFPLRANREKESFVKRKAIVGLALMLAGCDLQPNFILVMTTFDVNGSATGQTVIERFRSKEKCQFAGDQWRNSLGDIRGKFICLEPK
jgi:hypothetical protein